MCTWKYSNNLKLSVGVNLSANSRFLGCCLAANCKLSKVSFSVAQRQLGEAAVEIHMPVSSLKWKLKLNRRLNKWNNKREHHAAWLLIVNKVVKWTIN